MKRFLVATAVAALVFLAMALLVMVLGKVAQGVAWYGELKTWQTGLGAFAGLLAILTGALYNADLVRRRDDRLRADEAMQIVRALYAEVKFLRQNIANRRDSAKRIGAKGTPMTKWHFLVLTFPRPLVYPNAVHRVGLLPDDVLADLVEFYARVSLAQQVFEDATEDHPGVGRPLEKQDVKFFETTLQLADAVLPRLKKAARLA